MEVPNPTQNDGGPLRTGHRHVWREDHLKTQGEDGHPQTKGRGLRRNQPCRHLNRRLPASKCADINVCGLSPKSVVLLGPPWQTQEGHLATFLFTRPSVISDLVTSTEQRDHVIRKVTCRPWLYIPRIKKCMTMILDSPILLPILLISEEEEKTEFTQTI